MTTSILAAPWGFRVARGCVALAVIIALPALSGCTPKASPPAPVHGQVLLDDQPVAEAVVVLYPAQATGPDAKNYEAHCDAEGRFKIADGVPPGDYQISVVQRANRFDGERSIRDGRNMLAERYSDPKTSELKYKVVEGENEIPPLKLIGE